MGNIQTSQSRKLKKAPINYKILQKPPESLHKLQLQKLPIVTLYYNLKPLISMIGKDNTAIGMMKFYEMIVCMERADFIKKD